MDVRTRLLSLFSGLLCDRSCAEAGMGWVERGTHLNIHTLHSRKQAHSGL